MSRGGAKPITRQRSTWQPMPSDEAMPWLRWYHRRLGGGTLVAAVATPDGPEAEWHLSISFRDHRGKLTRYPTWDEIVHARELLLPDDLAFKIVLPRRLEYVALHDTTFHLYEDHTLSSD